MGQRRDMGSANERTAGAGGYGGRDGGIELGELAGLIAKYRALKKLGPEVHAQAKQSGNWDKYSLLTRDVYVAWCDCLDALQRAVKDG